MIENLKSKLELENYELTNQEIDFMLENIGHESKEIRDDLIFDLFAKSFYLELLNIDQLRYIYNKIVSKELVFFNIESADVKNALIRSYSILLLSLLISFSSRKEYKYFNALSKNEKLKIFEIANKYIELEKCLVGYSYQYGWVDCFTHAVQLLIDIVKNGVIEGEDVSKTILNSIKKSLLSLDDEIGDGQAKKFGNLLASLYKNSLVDHDQILEFINELFANQEYEKFSIQRERRNENINNMLMQFSLFINDVEILNKIKKVNMIPDLIKII
ncbi:DUF2785 domain-containing protein [Metamycoplasma spumans]|uniref:DUF2785 domain-containing protein n=1 Tax=Metamycoplasma spumans TaxID=92406 RepID=UPI0034DD37BE